MPDLELVAPWGLPTFPGATTAKPAVDTLAKPLAPFTPALGISGGNVLAAPYRPSSSGSGLVYDWITLSGEVSDVFGTDLLYAAATAAAELGYRPAYFQMLSPGLGVSASCVGIWVQDDDSAYQYSATLLRKPPGGIIPDTEVSDLSWFVSQLSSVGDSPVPGGPLAGWRPISIAAARFDHQSLGPVVLKTDYAVAWLRDGMSNGDWKVLGAYSLLGESLQDQLETQRDEGFRPISILQTEEGYATIYVRDGVTADDWRMTNSIATFFDEDWDDGFRPIAMIPGAVISVRQRDPSYWGALSAPADEFLGTATMLHDLGKQIPCFTLEDDTWWLPALHRRRGTESDEPSILRAVGDALVTQGDAELDRWVREDVMMAQDVSAAVLAVARDGEVVVHRAYTWGPEGEPETTPETPMRIASVSKSITAVAVMHLLEEVPTVSLDMPVFSVPGMPQPSDYTSDQVFDVTIRDLLRHTCGWGGGPLTKSPAQMAVDLGAPPLQWTGLAMYNRSQLVRYCLNSDGQHPDDPETFFNFSASKVGDTEAGFQYSNFGFMLLAELIEIVTGTSYETYVTSSLLDPLGMSSTYFAASARFDVSDAEPIYSGDNGYFGDATASGGAGHAVVGASRYGLFTNSPSIVPTQYGAEVIQASADGSDGWVSTGRDLLRFLMAFDQPALGMVGAGGEPILTPASVSTMWSTEVTGLGAAYGLGWQRSVPGGIADPSAPDIRYHGGNQVGTFAMILHWARQLPANKFNVVLLMNRNRSTYNVARDKFIDCLQMGAPAAPPVGGLGVLG